MPRADGKALPHSRKRKTPTASEESLSWNAPAFPAPSLLRNSSSNGRKPVPTAGREVALRRHWEPRSRWGGGADGAILTPGPPHGWLSGRAAFHGSACRAPGLPQGCGPTMPPSWRIPAGRGSPGIPHCLISWQRWREDVSLGMRSSPF